MRTRSQNLVSGTGNEPNGESSHPEQQQFVTTENFQHFSELVMAALERSPKTTEDPGHPQTNPSRGRDSRTIAPRTGGPKRGRSRSKGKKVIGDTASSSPQGSPGEEKEASEDKSCDKTYRTSEDDSDTSTKKIQRPRPGQKHGRTERSQVPFTKAIMEASMPRNFQMPSFESYDGTTDPEDHLGSFRNTMLLHGAPDEIMCRAFPGTLRKSARVWFSRLEPRSIYTFGQLAALFVGNFISSRRYRRSSASLMSLRQQKGESLRAFMARFSAEALEVDDYNHSIATAAISQGASNYGFSSSLLKKPPRDRAELLARAEKYIHVEEGMKVKREINEDTRDRGHPQETNVSRYGNKREKNRPDQGLEQKREERRSRYTSLNTAPSRILMEIKDREPINWPPKMKGQPGKRRTGEYCRFHQESGHLTNDCRQLREEIERRIQKGSLRRYVNKGRRDPPARQGSPVRERENERFPLPGPPVSKLPTINTIFGGPGLGGDSSSSRKAYSRAAKSVYQVHQLPTPVPPILFTNHDLEGIIFPHDDAVVVTMTIANYDVKRILIDSGSSADILFLSTFEKMNLDPARLRKGASPLFGFSGVPVDVEGMIELPVIAGETPNQSTIMINFQVIKMPSSYNAIIGRPTLNALKAVVSTYHLKVKFPTTGGIGEMIGDQAVSRSCYAITLKEKLGGKVVTEEKRKDQSGRTHTDAPGPSRTLK